MSCVIEYGSLKGKVKSIWKEIKGGRPIRLQVAEAERERSAEGRKFASCWEKLDDRIWLKVPCEPVEAWDFFAIP